MCRIASVVSVALLPVVLGGMQEPSAHKADSAPRGVSVFNAGSVKEPQKGAAELVDLHESEHMVTRVMRLAPGANIKEHYHPNFDETFFVHAGALKLKLDDEGHELRAGDTVIMPAGTIISGSNTGSEEAIVVIVWANIGKKGPLFVHGRPDPSREGKR